ncbi:hypothetical protein OIU34_03130 [Pararhizobium sp. BT-229]|uniref:hypothetical protein n=1 Tax=Pararhizobium sp. BT-229 TaxID=2986923 RepID=UPI0021F717E0|nr:hypothetical protein [Pararhizobium sp. BT-229]MCV9960884.1 hypothetical protein [Pararhizobium sp. BT-229]
MKPGPIFSDAQLKLWMRRVQTEMSKGTPPQEALDLVKEAMKAQSAGEEYDLPEIEPSQKSAIKF